MKGGPRKYKGAAIDTPVAAHGSGIRLGPRCPCAEVHLIDRAVRLLLEQHNQSENGLTRIGEICLTRTGWELAGRKAFESGQCIFRDRRVAAKFSPARIPAEPFGAANDRQVAPGDRSNGRLRPVLSFFDTARRQN
jgi:hypothetical protein